MAAKEGKLSNFTATFCHCPNHKYPKSCSKIRIRQQMLSLGHKRIIELNPGDEIISVNSHWSICHSIARKDFRTCKKILTEMINNDARAI